MKSQKQPKLQTLDKALNVIELFLQSRDKADIRLSEIARLADLDKATTSRILSTFANRGYLIQKEKRGKYSLGMAFLAFSGLIKRRIKIRDIAMPYLIKLNHSINESIVFAISNGKYITFKEIIPSDYPLAIFMTEGTADPLYCTSVGKIILSAMSELDIDLYFNTTELVVRTPNTIVDPNYLKNELIQIRRENIAIDNEEYALGIKGIATGVIDGEGTVCAAVGVLAIATRLTQSRIEEILPELKNCVHEISLALSSESNKNTNVFITQK